MSAVFLTEFHEAQTLLCTLQPVRMILSLVINESPAKPELSCTKVQAEWVLQFIRQVDECSSGQRGAICKCNSGPA